MTLEAVLACLHLLALLTMVVFLSSEAALCRAEWMNAAVVKRLARLDMHLDVSDAALMELASAGFDPVFGARPLKRAIQEHIENPLAKRILEGQFAAKDTIRVGVEGDRIAFAKD